MEPVPIAEKKGDIEINDIFDSPLRCIRIRFMEKRADKELSDMDSHSGNTLFCMGETLSWGDCLCCMPGPGSFVSASYDRRGNWGGRWMVLHCKCPVFNLKRMSCCIFVRNIFLQYLQSGLCCFRDCEQKADQREKTSVPSVFASGRILACASANVKGRFYSASFTVEAALVLSAVFFAIAALMCHALCVHDIVSGSMILEEMVEKIRCRKDGDELEEVYEAEGIRKGSPRPYLGDYKIDIQLESSQVSGTAKAGDWEGQISMKRFQPEIFLRRMEALLEIGDGMDAGEDGV